MTVTLTCGISKVCPFRYELDFGELVITIGGDAPELHDLGARVTALTADPISHEEFTRKVRDLLPPGSSVVTTWETGPWRVEVEEGG